MIPFMTAPKEHRCQFSIKLPSQCRRKRHSTNVVRLKLFDPCSCQKRAIKYFVFTHRRAQHDFAGNLGAIFELMTKELDKKITTKSFGEATGRISAKKYFLAWHGQ
jgi:hypothetical protein